MNPKKKSTFFRTNVCGNDQVIMDPEKDAFSVQYGNDQVIIGGFVLFFPNYSTCLGKPGLLC